MTASSEATGLRRLKTRSEFLRAARGKRAGRPSFALQSAPNTTGDTGVGFTVTKKTGNSPERNRIKRRLRAAVTACARDFAAGNDYVLIGRREALAAPFGELVRHLGRALARVNAPDTHDNTARPKPAGQRNSR